MIGDAFLGEKRPLSGFWKVLFGAVVGLGVAALLYPIFATAPSGHLPASCLSRLKSLAFTQFIYSQDFDDGLPPFYSFDGPEAREAFVAATYPYSKNGSWYVCRLAPESKLESQFSKPVLGYQHFLLILRQQSAKSFIRLTNVRDPARDAWMHDTVVKLEIKPNGEHIETHHGPGRSGFFVSFFDGHSKWVPTTSEQGREWINTMGAWQK